jgi:hypothetical protein
MKRYRWTNFYLDTDRGLLQDPSIPDEVKQAFKVDRLELLSRQYGAFDLEGKFHRWSRLQVPSLCAPIEYLELLHEVEDAFVLGAFYPALTAACCLGERILNHLVLQVRVHYVDHPRYKEAWRRESVDDWGLAISLLTDWQTLDQKQRTEFNELLGLRNPAVHFGSVLERETSSRRAVQLVYSITESLFSPAHDRFSWTPGEIYIKKSYETDPLTLEFVLPHCIQVGYAHTIEQVEIEGSVRLAVQDNQLYDTSEISDDEFRVLREAIQSDR